MAKLITIDKGKDKSIKNVVDKSFDSISKKVGIIELKLQLMASEIQIDKILQDYDILSKDKMDVEEKYLFADYLFHIFNRANTILKYLLEIKYKYEKEHNLSYAIDFYDAFNVNKEKIINALELLQSSDIHDRVIGIDNFMSLSHTNSTLLPDLISVINGVTVLYEEADDETIVYYFEWRTKVDKHIIEKLNEIRNRKGLSRFSYEDM